MRKDQHAAGVSAVAVSRLVNRNVFAERGRTSMRLEPELWDALAEICDREGKDISALVRGLEREGHAGGRTSAIRVFVISYFRDAASANGHAAADHGRRLASRYAKPTQNHALADELCQSPAAGD